MLKDKWNIYGAMIQMQATLERNEINKRLTEQTSSVNRLLNMLETADNKAKSEIENELVNLGETVIPELITNLQSIKGMVRGVIAMVLIRLGQCSVSYLQRAALQNSDFEWMAKYLISEINISSEIAA